MGSLIKENGLADHLGVYTDSSVRTDVRSGLGYTAILNDQVIIDDFGYVDLTTSFMCMEVKAIAEMLDWIKRQAITRVVCLTDSMSTLAKVQKGLLHADWITSIRQSNFESVR